MTAFYLVVFFPLLAGVGFGLIQSLLQAAFGLRANRLLVRFGGWIYLVFLSVPVCAVARHAGEQQALAAMGLRWPAFPPLPTALTVIAAGLAAAALGCLLYLNELVLSSALGRWLPRNSPLAGVVEGRSRLLKEQAPGFVGYMGCSALIVAAEEFVWRGFLIYFLVTRMAVSMPAAILLTAALFGLNHAYYGARNVLLKTFDGAIWGLLQALAGSLLAPITSHLTFQLFVWRRMRRLHAAA